MESNRLQTIDLIATAPILGGNGISIFSQSKTIDGYAITPLLQSHLKISLA